MKTFEEWTQDLEPWEPEFPSNISYIHGTTNGIMAECCVCKEWFDCDYWEDIKDNSMDDLESMKHYCGESPRCCP